MKKILAVLLTAAMLLATLSMIVFAAPLTAVQEQKTGEGFATANDTDGYYDATEFFIGTLADLEEFAEDTYKAGHNYLGKTVYLTADITVNATYSLALSDYAHTVKSISGNHSTSDNDKQWGFSGVFDGQNYSIRNFKGQTDGSYGGGLFQRLWSLDANNMATVKNLTINGFYSDNTSCTQGWIQQGVLVDNILRGAVIDNVTLRNATVNIGVASATGEAAAGLICGRFATEAQGGFGDGTNPTCLKITNTVIEPSCKFTYSDGAATMAVGGIVGYMRSNNKAADADLELTCSAIAPAGDLKPIGLFHNDGLPTGITIYAAGARIYDKTTSAVVADLDAVNAAITSAEHLCYGVTTKPEVKNTFDASDYANTTLFTISTVADLEAFALDTLKAGHNYQGKTVVLANDIVINDTSVDKWYEKSPVVMPSICGNYHATDDNANLWGFTGVFDGQGHAIKGWVGKSNDNQKSFSGALFSRINGDDENGVTVKNLVIDGFYSKTPAQNSTDQGVIADQIIKGANIVNVTIRNAILDYANRGSDGGNYHCSGIICGAFYADASSFATDFWLTMSCVTVEPSCKFIKNGVVCTNSASPSENLAVIAGRYWGAGGSITCFEVNSSSFNVTGIGVVQKAGQNGWNSNTAAVKARIDGVEYASAANDALVGRNVVNNNIKASSNWGPESTSHLHDIAEYNGLPATCQQDGYAELLVCKYCSYSSGGEKIASVDHKYENGSCVWCTVAQPAGDTTTTPDAGTTTPAPDAGTTTPTPDAGTTAPTPDAGTTAPIQGTTTAPTDEPTEPTDGTTAAPVAEDDCASCGGAGAIAAIAVAVVSVFGLALIIKKH